jgi:type II secretory pathway pseudopilin PulG
MNKKGYTIPELLGVLGVFTIIYIIGVISVAHAFKYDKIEEEYNAVLNLMRVQAENYAKDNSEELFKEKDITTIYANDLVKNNYYKADDNGNIIDPRDTTKNLNDIKIEIKKDGETYTAKIFS